MCVKCSAIEEVLCKAQEGINFATVTLDDALGDVYRIHREALNEGQAIIEETGTVSIAHCACTVDLVNAYMRMQTAIRALKSIERDAEEMLNAINDKGVSPREARRITA